MIKKSYEKYVLPKLLDCCCSTKPINYQRKKVVPNAKGNILEIGIGTVIGTSLTKDSLVDLQSLWRPAILITFTLVITGLAIGLWTSRLLNIDVITTILGAAPGGISGMSLVGSEYGVGAAVATLHAVRLITVLLILPLVVKCLNIFGVIKS